VAAADAADAVPATSNSRAEAILTLVASMNFIGDLLDRNDRRPSSPNGGTDRDGRSDGRVQATSTALLHLRPCQATGIPDEPPFEAADERLPDLDKDLSFGTW
jgi:hypothetical protein